MTKNLKNIDINPKIMHLIDQIWHVLKCTEEPMCGLEFGAKIKNYTYTYKYSS